MKQYGSSGEVISYQILTVCQAFREYGFKSFANLLIERISYKYCQSGSINTRRVQIIILLNAGSYAIPITAGPGYLESLFHQRKKARTAMHHLIFMLLRIKPKSLDAFMIGNNKKDSKVWLELCSPWENDSRT